MKKPIVLKSYSGKIPESVLNKLKIIKNQSGMTLQEVMLDSFTKYIAQFDFKEVKIRNPKRKLK